MDSIRNSDDFTNPKKRKKKNRRKLQRKDSLALVKKKRRMSILTKGKGMNKGFSDASDEPLSRKIPPVNCK